MATPGAVDTATHHGLLKGLGEVDKRKSHEDRSAGRRKGNLKQGAGSVSHGERRKRPENVLEGLALGDDREAGTVH